MADVRIDVTVESDGWRDLLSDLAALAARALEAAATVLGPELPGPVEVSLVFTDDDGIAALNRDHRGKDGPTNVLSFPLEAADAGDNMTPAMIGDIVLAAGTIVREATMQQKTVEAHVCHLLIHGMLHLVGYDHEQDDDADEMERREVAALGQLGFADPYRDPPASAADTAALP